VKFPSGDVVWVAQEYIAPSLGWSAARQRHSSMSMDLFNKAYWSARDPAETPGGRGRFKEAVRQPLVERVWIETRCLLGFCQVTILQVARHQASARSEALRHFLRHVSTTPSRLAGPGTMPTPLGMRALLRVGVAHAGCVARSLSGNVPVAGAVCGPSTRARVRGGVKPPARLCLEGAHGCCECRRRGAYSALPI